MATLTPCLIRVLIWTSVSSDNLQSDNPFGPRTKSDLFSSYPLSRGEPSVSYETHLAIGTAERRSCTHFLYPTPSAPGSGSWYQGRRGRTSPTPTRWWRYLTPEAWRTAGTGIWRSCCLWRTAAACSSRSVHPAGQYAKQVLYDMALSLHAGLV